MALQNINKQKYTETEKNSIYRQPHFNANNCGGESVAL
jgi:hypothetical protein